MRVSCALCGLLLAVSIVIVNCSPIVKREAEDELSPLNEVYVVEADEDTADDERGDRDKRKIVTLGIKNGIINFVFGKLDSFIDSKTKALDVLDESNKAKNAAFGIDPKQSATSQFISNLVSQKIQAATGSIGPLINSATTLFSGASAGLSNAFASKLAPLSSLSGGLLGGGASGGAGTGGTSGGTGAIPGSAIIGDLLTSKINTFTSLSQGSGGLGGLGSLSNLSGGSSGSGGSDTSSGSANADASAGVGLGAFANLAGRTTTTEDTPVFDRTRVSLAVPSTAFSTGFTLITNISQVLGSVIMNSARRTQTFLEIFKPFFRGAFAINGLPSDNPK